MQSAAGGSGGLPKVGIGMFVEPVYAHSQAKVEQGTEREQVGAEGVSVCGSLLCFFFSQSVRLWEYGQCVCVCVCVCVCKHARARIHTSGTEFLNVISRFLYQIGLLVKKLVPGGPAALTGNRLRDCY